MGGPWRAGWCLYPGPSPPSWCQRQLSRAGCGRPGPAAPRCTQMPDGCWEHMWITTRQLQPKPPREPASLCGAGGKRTSLRPTPLPAGGLRPSKGILPARGAQTGGLGQGPVRSPQATRTCGIEAGAPRHDAAAGSVTASVSWLSAFLCPFGDGGDATRGGNRQPQGGWG